MWFYGDDSPGVTIALTSGEDDISDSSDPALTENDDTVTGAINTLTSGDSIVDSSTTDNDSLEVELVANVDSTVTIT
ncbi:MAG: hypothetical protein ABR542_11575, partial [Desulfonatronovibrio sp.]